MNRFWALVHNCVAHPLLGIATVLHDWSAERAYARQVYPPEVEVAREREKGSDVAAELLKAADRRIETHDHNDAS